MTGKSVPFELAVDLLSATPRLTVVEHKQAVNELGLSSDVLQDMLRPYTCPTLAGFQRSAIVTQLIQQGYLTISFAFKKQSGQSARSPAVSVQRSPLVTALRALWLPAAQPVIASDCIVQAVADNAVSIVVYCFALHGCSSLCVCVCVCVCVCFW